MKKVKLIELSKKGTNFEIKIPANTKVSDIQQAIALFIVDSSKYRGIKPATALSEIQQWVVQLEENL